MNTVQRSLESVGDKLWSWLDNAVMMLPNLIIAILVMVIFYFLARLIKKGLLHVMNRFSTNQAVTRLLSNLITVVVLVLGLFVALGIMNLDKTVTSLLAGAGVIGLAVGLAFQDTMLNIISGVVLSMKDMPFQIGDLVKTNGYFGHVQRITLRNTLLKTLSGEDVVIPNKMVVQNPIENFSYTTGRRIDVRCGVAYDSDLEKVRELTISTIQQEIKIDTNKGVEFLYREFGPSSINFEVRFWLTDPQETAYLSAQNTSIIAIKKAFDGEGITIPYPIQTVVLQQPNAPRD